MLQKEKVITKACIIRHSSRHLSSVRTMMRMSSSAGVLAQGVYTCTCSTRDSLCSCLFSELEVESDVLLSWQKVLLFQLAVLLFWLKVPVCVPVVSTCCLFWPQVPVCVPVVSICCLAYLAAGASLCACCFNLLSFVAEGASVCVCACVFNFLAAGARPVCVHLCFQLSVLLF